MAGPRQSTDIYLRERVLSSTELASMLANDDGTHRIYPGFAPEDDNGNAELPVIVYIRLEEVHNPELNSSNGPDAILYNIGVAGKDYEGVTALEELLMPILEQDFNINVLRGGGDDIDPESWLREWIISVDVQDHV